MKHSIYKTREELPMYLNVMDVADLLGISRASAYELVPMRQKAESIRKRFRASSDTQTQASRSTPIPM